jgi:NhaP-type Na+/H+ or K+/H+ antiporter
MPHWTTSVSLFSFLLFVSGCSKLDYSFSYTSKGYDDYFQEFSERHCCIALMKHHTDYCEEPDLLSNGTLVLAAVVLLLCECAKAVVQRYELHFLPEAASCILVGTFVGAIFSFITSNSGKRNSYETLSFDNDLFLSLLLPPIIFDAALSVSKYEFKRRRGAIVMFAVMGTIVSTFTTGFFVHYTTKALDNVQTFPVLDSLVFGALISSIDPVAILSVLTSLNMDQKDTIFILVFGESLLNDGIAITVFQTLVDRFDGKTTDGTTSLDEILDALATFLISMFASISVGLLCGICAMAYFKVLRNHLPPVMEVGSFFIWALVPYYICDEVGWSGIVSIVTVAFFLDVYVAGPKVPSPSSVSNDYMDMERPGIMSSPSDRSVGPLPFTERLPLSPTADRHVRFVAHLTAHLAENAIFAYLGLFLFSSNYDWDPTLVIVAIVACVFSRAFMVFACTWSLHGIYKVCKSPDSRPSRTAESLRDGGTKAVLILAGLRGAVSLALVENVPIYNSMTGEGCEFKPLMKGMTSAAILFTTFVFGGGAYYILPHLGIQPVAQLQSRTDSVIS